MGDFPCQRRQCTFQPLQPTPNGFEADADGRLFGSQERLGLARLIVIPNNSTRGLMLFNVRVNRMISFVCYLASVIYEIVFMYLDSYMCILIL